MACGSVPYTLVGFAPELDWRPLHFLKPIPRVRVCSTCGLVRTKTALLSCMHVVCGSCYDQCAQDGPLVCPLDGLQCQEEDVKWKEWSAEELLKREVKCWNAENGCRAAMAASTIFQHFQRDCGYHSARCPKCSASVLCSDVWAHLKSNCTNLATPLSSECGGQTVRRGGPISPTSPRRMLEEQAGEMKALFEQLLSESNAQSDRLNEILHGQNAFTETLKRELSQAARQITASNEEINRSTVNCLSSRIGALDETFKRDSANATRQIGDNFSRLAAAVESAKAEANENSEDALGTINSVFEQSMLQIDHCEFFVKGVTSLQAEAKRNNGRSGYKSELVQLRGYCMSPGIYLKNDGASVKLHLWLEVHKGEIDAGLLWPLEHRMRLSVMHPKEAAKQEIEVKPWRADEGMQRPLESSNTAVYFPSRSLNLSDLVRDGYVYDDQLRVTFELLQ